MWEGQAGRVGVALGRQVIVEGWRGVWHRQGPIACKVMGALTIGASLRAVVAAAAAVLHAPVSRMRLLCSGRRSKGASGSTLLMEAVAGT